MKTENITAFHLIIAPFTDLIVATTSVKLMVTSASVFYKVCFFFCFLTYFLCTYKFVSHISSLSIIRDAAHNHEKFFVLNFKDAMFGAGDGMVDGGAVTVANKILSSIERDQAKSRSRRGPWL